LKNLFGGSITMPFPKAAPTEVDYRGQLQLDETRCIGCGKCATFCTTKVIEVKRDKDNKDAYQWSYDAGKCTFCGRCLDACKNFHALSMEATRPPVYTKIGALKQLHNMIRKRPAAAPKPAATAATPAAAPAAATAPAATVPTAAASTPPEAPGS
jgi:formate hydrogenlyase subunit 6/NADH:ubiquinone oxidoreductase subunit I